MEFQYILTSLNYCIYQFNISLSKVCLRKISQEIIYEKIEELHLIFMLLLITIQKKKTCYIKIVLHFDYKCDMFSSEGNPLIKKVNYLFIFSLEKID